MRSLTFVPLANVPETEDRALLNAIAKRFRAMLEDGNHGMTIQAAEDLIKTYELKNGTTGDIRARISQLHPDAQQVHTQLELEIRQKISKHSTAVHDKKESKALEKERKLQDRRGKRGERQRNRRQKAKRKAVRSEQGVQHHGTVSRGLAHRPKPDAVEQARVAMERVEVDEEEEGGVVLTDEDEEWEDL